jgi:N-acetylglucosamine malate deacetylase 1
MPDSSVDLLVIVCHEDDELYCAGTIRKYTREGKRVGVVYLTQGGFGHPFIEEDETKELRMAEARKACAILCAEEPVFLDFPDAYVPYSAELIAAIVDEIRKFRPRSVITHAINSSQRDHRNGAMCVLDSVRLAGQPKVKSDYPTFSGLKEVYSMNQSAAKLLPVDDRAVFHIDVSDEIDEVMACAKVYKTQIEGQAVQWSTPDDGSGIPDDLPDHYPGVRERAAREGKACGVAYAEPFACAFSTGNFAYQRLPIDR